MTVHINNKLPLEEAVDAGSSEHPPGRDMILRDGQSCSIGSFSEVAKSERVYQISGA